MNEGGTFGKPQILLEILASTCYSVKHNNKGDIDMAAKKKNSGIKAVIYAGLAILMLSIFSGCVSTIPERKYYREVLNMPYVKNKFYCT